MKRPWSISTTMRNPQRFRDFLAVLETLEGRVWDYDSQKEFQIRLIQKRHYGYGSDQFCSGLTEKQRTLVNDLNRKITLAEAREIFTAKDYEDPPMRGRNSASPLTKFGFALLEKGEKVVITELGKQLLANKYDLQEIFLRMLLKWQIPNPYNQIDYKPSDCDLKPFIGTLRLIQYVNQLEKANNRKAKGISQKEFCLFAPTLLRYSDVEKYAECIVDVRKNLENVAHQERDELWSSTARQFASNFLQSNNQNQIDKLLNNLKDYGDNAIRYFRLTSYIYIRGNGYFIDLESRRAVEINALLNSEFGTAEKFTTKQEFIDYITDPAKPTLPWDTADKQVEIISRMQQEVIELQKRHNFPLNKYVDSSLLSDSQRTKLIAKLSHRRREIHDIVQYTAAQSVEAIEGFVSVLDTIYDYERRPLLLEKTTTQCLRALNDAVAIKPQYPIGDDNEPISTAPANTPDIECWYQSFNAICEVTMLTRREQWYYEGQPVMRHLRDFEDQYPDRSAYCLFIAPRLHRDTINTFWTSIKFGYEGRTQRIVPLTIRQFSQILQILRELRSVGSDLSHTQIKVLFDRVLDLTTHQNDSSKWVNSISNEIQSWRETLVT